MTETTSPVAGAARRLSAAGLSAWGVLSVEREDIAFHNTRPGLLRVEVTVRNDGSEPTLPCGAMLRSAALGAFVPWHPLDIVGVPQLEPDESAVVRREYRVDAPRPLGSIDQLPPDRVLTALGLGDSDDNPRRRRRLAVTPSAAVGGLAPDLLGMLTLGGSHWAGNLNLFFPGKDVERHVAQALRVYPGRVNIAMFIVGERNDEYRFRLTGEASSWNARLYDAMRGEPIADGVKRSELAEGDWHQPHSGLLLLAVEPPATAADGAVNVHVTQRSTGREAVVEFTMDSKAAGPGCYKL